MIKQKAFFRTLQMALKNALFVQEVLFVFLKGFLLFSQMKKFVKIP
jgi:hypothetical protein